MSWIKELLAYLVALFSIGFFGKKINEDELFVIDGKTEGVDHDLGYLLQVMSGFKGIQANRKILEALIKIDGVADDKENYNLIINRIFIGNIIFITFISPSGFVYFIRILNSDIATSSGYEITDVLCLGKSRIYNTNNIEGIYTRNMARIVKEEDITNENFQMVVNVQENTFVLSISNIKQFAKYRQRNTDHFTIGFGKGDLVFLDKKSNTKKLK